MSEPEEGGSAWDCDGAEWVREGGGYCLVDYLMPREARPWLPDWDSLTLTFGPMQPSP